jgi:hypothetical protein
MIGCSFCNREGGPCTEAWDPPFWVLLSPGESTSLSKPFFNKSLPPQYSSVSAISAQSGINHGAILPSLEGLKTSLVEQFRPTVEDLTMEVVGMTC